jgi:acyl transferase domain-containing protein/NAD(P)H-dependent flavin oxidoreductase YrpB (nitropropane dioxygenase family)/NAD(P)-dependent dehydrogenase (short-subunit alcohol dehydrogenase family)/acyl carrier protein
MGSFLCFSLVPAMLKHPGVAIATARAGGIGILDLEFCRESDSEIAQSNWNRLINSTQPWQEIGLRLKEDRLAASQPWTGALGDRPHWLIVADWTTDRLQEILSSLPEVQGRRILLEVKSPGQLESLKNIPSIPIAGLVARGHEAGGWVGSDPAFILAQKLSGQSEFPVYIQGGIGIHTAAACRVAGAAGVVLDDQLWLMPESPLPESWKRYFKEIGGQEAAVFGERLGVGCRVLSRPGFKVIQELQQLADRIEIDQNSSVPLEKCWQQQGQELIGWGEPGQWAWPIGQAVGLAALLRDQYKTTGRLVQAVIEESLELIRIAQASGPLKPGSALAKSHRTSYPIVQGPMTRVSDTSTFAQSVAEGGGLPMIALALMRGSSVNTLLKETKAKLGDRSWGVGILGFVPSAIRQEQLQAIREVKPPFALIAGGRPDQAAQMESEGIATYIHVPTDRLLKMFLEQGARRFVFEGRECGGHIGPLSSFVLWESVIHTLLEHVPKGQESSLHILFAGGIHDDLSAAMVSAMAAPLAQRGMRIGVLMGTAYLFTEEAVLGRAILPEFQQQALQCRQTIHLETGLGHSSRCAATPFAREFYETRRRMMVEGASAEAIKDTLEDLTLGRLRIASKGTKRDASGEMISVKTEAQVQEGMYMIGQVATMRDQIVTIHSLHQTVSEQSFQRLEVALELAQPSELVIETQSPQPSDVAIIGIGTLLPQAVAAEEFWQNILNQVNAITEIPSDRWDWRLYFDTDRAARDKIYSKWGAFIDEVAFDPMRYGIPPKSLTSIEPLQLLTLETVRRALEDAGYGDGKFDRERTSVILGAGGGIGDVGSQYAARSEILRLMEDPGDLIWSRFPEWTEESFPGLLLNVAAGRVANRFDFGGTNMTVDAACGSSLAAIHLAVQELETGTSNVAIAGGIDTNLSPFSYLCFSKTHALSPTGQPRPFDQSADGIAISEGLAVVVMKRLADAERDGDRIYAIIKASASSSDGKALGMTAPRPAGQRRALDRVYAKAGISPITVGLYEAHGTGTAAGDRAELETVTQILKDHQAESKSCAVGSVKSLIGHTKSSAGVVGLIKAALSLHHKVLPPHYGVENPLDPLTDPQSPTYLLKEPHPWLAHSDYPRRAACSAFGFGGTNYHALLEEYVGDWKHPQFGADDWSYELFIFRAADLPALIQQLERLQRDLPAGSNLRLANLAYTLAREAQNRGHQPVCLGFVVPSLEELRQTLAQVLENLQRSPQPGPFPPHIQLGLAADQAPGKLAILFPGQGSQAIGMGREVALFIDEVRRALEFADETFRDKLPKRLSQFIYPPSSFSPEQEAEQFQELRSTAIAQPAIGTLEIGLLGLAQRLGIQPDMAGGHSYGEYVALHAAGAFSEADLLMLSHVRGQLMVEACLSQPGSMVAAQIGSEALQAYLKDRPAVFLSSCNTPLQSIISGTQSAVKEVADALNAEGVKVKMLPVAGGFHSPLMASAQNGLTEALQGIEWGTLKFPVYANVNASPHAPNPVSMREFLVEQLVQPVQFVRQIEAMYESGARIFLELSPRSTLSNMVSQILEHQDHVSVSFGSYDGGLRGMLIAIAMLLSRGVDLNLLALYRDRTVEALELSRLARLVQKPPLSPTAWMVNGARARQQTEIVKVPPPVKLESLVTGHQTALPKVNPLHSPEAILQTTPQPNGSQPIASQQPASIASSPSVKSLSLPQRSTQSFSPKPLRSTDPSSVIKPSIDGAKYTPMNNNEYFHVPDGALAVYQSYQETMRYFLASQEHVIHHILDIHYSDLNSPSYPIQSTTPSPSLPMANSPSLVRPVTNGHTEITPMIMTPPQPIAAKVSSPASRPASSISPVPGSLFQSPSRPLPQPPTATPAPIASAALKNPVVAVSSPAVVPQSIVTPTPQGISDFPATPTAVDRNSLTQLLLELVSDRTGYPMEMLGLEQDIEAELGVDSIKRVEVLGAFEKNLPTALMEKVKVEMDDLTRVKTLSGLIDRVLGLASGNGILQAAAPPSIAATNDNGGVVQSPLGQLDRASLSKMLLDIVSDRTGYPVEMLGLNQDIEAELGIDSIKRVEVLGMLQKSLPDALANSLQGQMDNLTRVKTLSGLLDEVLNLVGATGVQEDVRLGKPDAGAGSIPRYVIRAKVQPLSQATLHPLSGLYLVTEDGLGLTAKLAAVLGQQGAQVAILNQDTLKSVEKLTQTVNRWRSQYGPIAGLVHLAPVSTAIASSFEAWRESTLTHVKRLFTLLQLSAADAQQTGQFRVVSASLLGGAFGRNGNCGPGLATGGVHNGLMKTLNKEWPGIHAKALDLDSAQPLDNLVEQIIQELATDEATVEVGYPQGQRTCFKSILMPLPENSQQQLYPAEDWVVLVTGGSRGITAEVMKSFMVPGMTLVIVGRSPEPMPEGPETQGITDPAELRRCLLAKARSLGESPTPAQLEKTMKSLQNTRESFHNLEWFRQQGQVEYHAIDVRDWTSFSGLVKSIYQRYGRLDAVIHGAGIIEDKLVIDKPIDSLERVFDTKADSAFILDQVLLPESLKLFAFFASVAGRFGNRGQGDYASANEVVTRLVCQLDRRWPKTRVVAIHWGPWDTTGMASQGVKNQLRQQGMVPIPLDAGAKFFVEEVLYGHKGETEVIAGEGPWLNLQ